ncbi:MAG: hypothetical protein ACI9EW_000867 [Cellvibrionaceae bacterium]|jgi:hypothetical protein
MDPLKVLVLYGGEAATKPRNELLSWLNSPELHTQIGRKIDARKVAEMTAHTDQSINDRVDTMIDWADKGIVLLTPDPRGTSGAPNVVEEFGRWLGRKGGRSLATLRHKEVEVHSNASGLVYIGFENNIIDECGSKLIAFINNPVQPAESQAAQITAPPAQTINSGPTFNISGGVGGDLTAGDKVGGNVYHVSGNLNISNANQLAGNGNPQSATPESNTAPAGSTAQTIRISISQLRAFLTGHYGKRELLGICLDLKIDSDDFDSSKTGLILDLIPYLQRRDRLGELLDKLAKDPDQRLEKQFGIGSNFVIDG